MKISDTYPYIGSFIGGALAAGLAVRPGLNGHAIKVLGAGGVAGTALAVASFVLFLKILDPFLNTFPGYEDMRNTKMRGILVVTTLSVLIVSVSAVAGAALMNRMGFPISYKTATAVAGVATVGLFGGAFVESQYT